MTLSLLQRHAPEPTLLHRTSLEVILGAEMLALASGPFEAVLDEELAANPALRRCPSDGLHTLPGWEPRSAVDVVELLADEESDRQSLLSATRLLLPASEHDLAEAVVGALDSRLYLAAESTEFADQLGVSVTRVDTVVDAVQQAGPPGTAARNLRECLLAQLDAIGTNFPDRGVVRAVVDAHLDALAAGRLSEIARSLHVTTSEISGARDVIRSRLRPCAVMEGATGRPPQPPPPPPELVFRASARGGHEVHVLERRRVAVEIDPTYERAAQASGQGSCLRADLRRARRFLGRLDERWDMMRAVGEALALHQDAFLRLGPSHLYPLTRTQVARELDVHESTVCRTVSNKHAGLPDGSVIPLATLFSGPHAALDALRDLILQEPQPMSDAMLAEAMRRRGFPIARRTVAKYRSLLDIPPMGRRHALRSAVRA